MIRKAMSEDGITSLNLFVNGAGEFQANTGRRSDRVYAVKRDEDPVNALVAAIKSTPKKIKPNVDFEDILG
jgi:hypothetical protein